MRISNITLERLLQMINGDETNHYKTGPQLIKFFNQLGFNDIYGPTFGSRKDYTYDNLQKLNDDNQIEKVIESYFAPVNWIRDEITFNSMVQEINKYLKYDNLRLEIGDTRSVLVVTRPSQTSSITTLCHFNHLHIQEQIDKCQEKIQSEDYSGAITNARTLLEHLFEYIYKELTNQEFDNDKLTAKYKALSKNLNLDPANLETSTDELRQILSGFISVISGFACFSNDWGDRHARKFNPLRHHAQLAVNSAFTLCEFLLSSYEYQKK